MFSRYVLPTAVFLGSILLLNSASLAQGRGGRSSAPAPSSGNTGPSAESTARFISGKVTIDDGTLLTDQATIQSNCKGQRHAETRTDSSGNFNFEFGRQRTESDDIESSSMGKEMQANTPARSGARDRLSSDCQLLAVLPGFTSDVVELSRYQDEQLLSINVGKIVLHRLHNVEGSTISATTAAAPPEARKAFEKAREDETKGKLEDAQKKLEKAVSIYPNFAVAWAELGRLQVHFKNFDQARESFHKAMAADRNLATPYEELAQMAFQQRQWEELVNDTDQLLRLNPLSFPQGWFYNAIGNFYLNRLDTAEKSARETLKTDITHRFPKADYLLAVILMQKKDFGSAAEHFRSYLAHLATPSEAASVQAELAKAERLSQAQVTQGQARP